MRRLLLLVTLVATVLLARMPAARADFGMLAGGPASLSMPGETRSLNGYSLELRALADVAFGIRGRMLMEPGGNSPEDVTAPFFLEIGPNLSLAKTLNFFGVYPPLLSERIDLGLAFTIGFAAMYSDFAPRNFDVAMPLRVMLHGRFLALAVYASMATEGRVSRLAEPWLFSTDVGIGWAF